MILPILTLLVFQGTAGPGRNVFQMTFKELSDMAYANAWVRIATEHKQKIRDSILESYHNGRISIGESDGDGCWPRTTTTCTIEGDYVVCIDSTERECINTKEKE